MLPGNRWRATHQSSANSILGSDPQSPSYRKVTSEGVSFFNRDHWYARNFGSALCRWSHLNRESFPTEEEVQDWLFTSRCEARSLGNAPGIWIAQTPDELPRGLAMALVGGTLHEAWHTLYSRRTPLTIEEVWPNIQKYWAMIPYKPEEGYRGWARLTEPMLVWANIIEDIRIERLGNKQFLGAYERMESLQDLILEMEQKGKKEASDEGLDLRVVMCAFRDLGLGYKTRAQTQALREYKSASPRGWSLVTQGALKPVLERAKNLTKEDSLGSLWLAMEVMIILSEEAAKKITEAAAKKIEAAAAAKEAPPAKPEQLEATGEDNEVPEKGEGQQSPKTKKPPIYKVGDKVRITKGIHLGKIAQVIRAGLPDPETGIQKLSFQVLDE